MVHPPLYGKKLIPSNPDVQPIDCIDGGDYAEFAILQFKGGDTNAASTEALEPE